MDRYEFQVSIGLPMRVTDIHHCGLTNFAFDFSGNVMVDHRIESVFSRNAMPVRAGFPSHRHELTVAQYPATD